QNPIGRERNGQRLAPSEVRCELLCPAALGLADQQGHPAAGSHQPGGDGQNLVEPLHGAQGDDGGAIARIAFRPAAKYIDVRQCKAADDLAQEGRLLVAGLEERQPQPGMANLDGQAGEACAGAYVDEMTDEMVVGSFAVRLRAGSFAMWLRAGCWSLVVSTRREEMLRGEDRFAEMAGEDLVWLAHRGQVHADIP